MKEVLNKSGPDSVRKQIREAAAALFQTYGYTKTTMADIAGDTGMSAANLYRYFTNKQDIAACCTDKYVDDRIAVIHAAIRQPGLGAKERLQAYALTTLKHSYAIVQENKKINELIEIVTNERREHIYRTLEAETAILMEILSFGNETGEFSIKDIAATAKSVHTSLTLFHIPNYMNLFTLDEFESKATALIQLITHGLKGQ